MAITRPEETREQYGCHPRAHCSNTNQAWRDGCRHPEAMAAHEVWLERQRGARESAIAAWQQTGQCHAPVHGSRRAYEHHGCRHPEAADAYEKWRARKSNAEQAWRDLGSAHEFAEHQRRVKRITGGRLDRDPRRPFRHGSAGVSRHMILDVMDGVRPDATSAEHMVAVLRLARRQVWDEGDYRTARFQRAMNSAEIGRRIGISGNQAARLKGNPAELRSQRTERRLADSQWRVAVAAAAADDPGRKARERRNHHLAAVERELRRRLYAVRKARRG